MSLCLLMPSVLCIGGSPKPPMQSTDGMSKHRLTPLPGVTLQSKIRTILHKILLALSLWSTHRHVTDRFRTVFPTLNLK